MPSSVVCMMEWTLLVCSESFSGLVYLYRETTHSKLVKLKKKKIVGHRNKKKFCLRKEIFLANAKLILGRELELILFENNIWGAFLQWSLKAVPIPLYESNWLCFSSWSLIFGGLIRRPIYNIIWNYLISWERTL